MSDYQDNVKKELGRFLELTKECEQAARLKEIDQILDLLRKRQVIIDSIDVMDEKIPRNLIEIIIQSNATLENELTQVRDMAAGEFKQVRREKQIAHYKLDSVKKTRLFDIESL